MDNNPARRLLSLGETANYLRLSRSTLYKYVERLTIPHIKIGSRIRFTPEDLDAWVAAKSVQESGS